MPSHESGFFESPFARTRSLIQNHSTGPRTIIARTASQLLPHKGVKSALRPGHRHSQSASAAPKCSVKSPVKRGMSFHHRRKSSKKGTILRAVPASAACATAPLMSKERDTAALPNQDTDSSVDGRALTRLLPQDSIRTRLRSSSATALSSIKAGTEMRSFASTPSLKGTIGIYKHGKIHWEYKDNSTSERHSRRSSQSRASSSARTHRPRIQVVIPKEQRNRPLPTSPFFTQPAGHIRSASAEIETMSDVSPPSGSKRSHARDSIVSPLSSQQTRPLQHFHASINAQITKSDICSPDPSNTTYNSSDDSRGDDASSTYSNQSSVTSAEAGSPACPSKYTSNTTHIIRSDISVNPQVGTGMPNSPPREATKSGETSHETGHGCAPLSVPQRHYAHHPRIQDDTEFIPTCSLQPHRNSSNSIRRRSSSARRSSNRNNRRSLSSNPAIGAINQAINRHTSKQFTPRVPSPTLSEAENDLEAQLTSFTDDNPFKWDIVVTTQDTASPLGEPRKDSITYDVPYCSPPPELPRKSSKRQSRYNPSNTFRLSRVPGDHIASQIKRNRSLNKSRGLSIIIPETKRMTNDDFVLSPIPIPPKNIKRAITPEVAENVILSILRNLESLDDLFATAVVNGGFYRVFKRHELELMKSALRKMSPPAWEHREICYPGHDDGEDDDQPRQEYTPSSYIQYYTRDMYIIAALKAMIKEKCQSFIRPEISAALVSEDQGESARVDDALWRIWTFCKIFGSGKGREEDIVAQMDWLKGGILVHQKACTYSVLSCDDLNETLASAPECFGKGNEGGLTAEQLFDMMELWNCLGVLLQPLGGRTIQAREYGVYDNTEVRGGDIDGEEIMLDEWYYYLLTLGLSAIQDLAGPSEKSDSSAFIIASQNGWMNWKPPIFGGTRRNFLKEAASRVYEDKIAVIYAESSTKEVQRQLSKQRIQRHITELRQRKNSGERRPEIRMSQERPISEWEGVISNLTRTRPPLPSPHTVVTHIPSLRTPSSLSHELNTTVPELPTTRSPAPPRSQSPPRRIVAQPLLPTPPPSTVPSTRDRSSMALSMPPIDEHPAFRRKESIPEMPPLDQHPMFAQQLRQMNGETARVPSASGNEPPIENHPAFRQHPLQRTVYGNDSPENTVDRAVYRIVEMGFTPEQARQALRKTDLGDGLRVDRAVELLLREMAL